MLSLALESKSNPPASFFGTLHELQMEVATYFKDKYTVCPSVDMVILVVDEISQEQWTVLMTALLSFGENVAMEIFIQTLGIGTIVLPSNAVTFFASFANDVCL